MKLYITAAYLRKHSTLAEIRSATNVRSLPFNCHSIWVTWFLFLAPDNCLYVLREVRKGDPRSANRFHVCDLQISGGTVFNLVRSSSFLRFSTP